MRLVSFTVSREPLQDPVLEALPRAEYERIIAISHDMRTNPRKHLAELRRLVERHPRIPLLRNQLAGALDAAGERAQAAAIVAETAHEFPTYVFAFCNHVMMLVSDGRIEQARALVETGPRGPVFTLIDFDPTRDTFHISEAMAHAAMVGHYMLATGRFDAAEFQLDVLEKTAPDSPQYRNLARAMGRGDGDRLDLPGAVRRLSAQSKRQSERRAQRAKARDPGTKPGRGTDAKGEVRPDAARSRDVDRGLFDA